MHSHGPHWQYALSLNPALGDVIDAGHLVDGRVRLYEPAALVIPGQWCPSSLNHYLHGQCALFALSLQTELAGSLIALVHGEGGIDEWVHAAVRMPNGDLIDASGRVNEVRVVQRWEAVAPAWGPFTTTTITSAEQVNRLLGSINDADPVDIQVARVYARQMALSLLPGCHPSSEACPTG